MQILSWIQRLSIGAYANAVFVSVGDGCWVVCVV